MVRRRLTLKRVDPWSMLKFGFVVNLSLLAIGLLGAAVLWFFVRRLGLIERVCSIATDVGFETCGVDGGNLFRAVLLLGLLGVVIMTGVAVFLAFLANLISDLTGGLSFTFVDDTPGAARRGEMTAGAGRTGPTPPVPAERSARSGETRARGAAPAGAGPGSGSPGTSVPPRGDGTQAVRPTPGSGAGASGAPATDRPESGSADAAGWPGRGDDAIFGRSGDETGRQ